MGVAHDILEHFPDDDGGVEAEFRALGASLFVRNFEQYYGAKGQRCTNPGENVGSDFPDIMRHVWHEGFSLAMPPGAQGAKRLDPNDVEPYLETAILEGQKNCRDMDESMTVEESIAAMRWMRLGYRAAVRRFYRMGASPTRLCELFEKIEDAANDILDNELYGDFRFRVDVKCGTVKVDCTEDY
jgi:hypothetical protein